MISVFANKAYLPEGWADAVRIEIDGGRIAALEADTQATRQDRRCDLVIPGLCNAHSHAFQRALAGHTEVRSPAGEDNFWTWRERMYALAGRLTPESMQAIARQLYCEMLAAGYTSVAEFHYLHRNPADGADDDVMYAAIAAAAAEAGIRLIYVPVFYERSGFGESAVAPEQASFALTLDQYLAHVERMAGNTGVSCGTGAHSLRAVSADSLAAIARYANQHDLPMHIHIAEQQREVDQCLAHHGARPVEWLLDRFEVRGNWCLVHATHINGYEGEKLAGSGAVVALCPSTEGNLGDGLFPLQKYLRDGGRIAIGSDSHITVNPFEELRWLEYGQRLVSQSRNVVALRNTHVGRELFDRALEGGAAATGLAATGLQVGAPADLVELDGDDPMLAGHDDESRLDALVFSGYPLPIDSVMVDGKLRVEDGVHTVADTARRAFAAAVAEVGTGV